MAGAAAGAGYDDVVIAAFGQEDEDVVIVIRVLFRDAKGEEVVLDMGAHFLGLRLGFDLITVTAETNPPSGGEYFGLQCPV